MSAAGRRDEQLELVAASRAAVAADPRRVLVLDDDPTGSQAAADVAVLLDPGDASLNTFLGGPERAAYVVTNTRSVDEAAARELIGQVRRATREHDVALVLRGDSTLRGHVFAEMDALGGPDSAELFVPAFPEGGRHTVAGVHYLVQEGVRVPVAETEFAQDPVFGFRAGTVEAWVREVGGDRPVRTLDLSSLRSHGPPAVARALLGAAPGTVVIPDAEDVGDVAAIVLGLLQAEQAGRPVVVRGAATLAALRAGAWSDTALDRVDVAAPGRTLVVCGSHTAAATAQLRALERQIGPPVVLSTSWALDSAMEVAPAAVVNELLDRLASVGVAVVASERDRRTDHSSLHAGARVMSLLTRTVEAVAGHCDLVVAKGGITSADVARWGLGARAARVVGQLAPGVSLWRLGAEGGAGLPYVVVPGNVGQPSLLVDLLGMRRVADGGPGAGRADRLDEGGTPCR
jgi:uncharacterized protein YgbK (DUF1537 family)